MNISNEDYLILVNEEDKPWGKLEKSLVHQLGLLHRAFSIFIFNNNGELLLQQRADDKYHSGGLWTNSCCSHPRYDEYILHAIDRRLEEEMGLQCKTEFKFNFIYKTEFENGLIEHEFDHVYFGVTDALPQPNSSEVKSWKYIDLHELENDINNFPEKYTVWLQLCFKNILIHFDSFAKANNLKTLSYASI